MYNLSISSFKKSILKGLATFLFLLTPTLLFAQLPGGGGGGGGGNPGEGLEFRHTGATSFPSPTAASFAKVQEIPVDLYNGTPNISIPLHDFSYRKISVPITLNYTSNGLKVQERAGWAGLGWNLQVGGVITRVVRGLPDDYNNKGYLYTAGDLKDSIPYPTSSEGKEILNQMAEGNYDGEPDKFIISTPTVSGEMFFMDGKFRLVFKQKVDIQYTKSGYKIVSWTVTDENGIKYTFDKVESTTMHTNTLYNSYPSSGTNKTYNSAWYLTKIDHPQQDTDVIFEYSTGSYYSTQTTYAHGRIVYDNSGPSLCYSKPNDTIESQTYMQNNAVYLTKIRLSDNSNTYVHFSNQGRSDLTQERRLSAIGVYENGVHVKEYKFTHGYFTNGGSHKRLRLDKIDQLIPGTSTPAKPPYEFTYSTIKIPTYDSKGVDHWGYYNGVTSNTHYVPTTTYGGTTIFTGANRNPWANTAGMLTKITYPTGGYTHFTYEGNDYSYVNSTAQSGQTPAGGMRIKKIVYHDGISTSNDVIKNYNYDMNDGSGRSSGVVTGTPTNVEIGSKVFYDPDTNSNYTCYYKEILPSSFYSLGDFTADHLGYKKVTETVSGSGGYGEIVHYFEKNPYEDRGSLVKKEIYDSSDDLVQQEKQDFVYGNGLSNPFYYWAQGLVIERQIDEYTLKNGMLTVLTQDTSFVHKPYTVFDQWTYLDSDTLKVYNSESGHMKTFNEYTYNSGNLQLSSKKTNVDGEVLVTDYRYASDQYPGMAAANMYTQLYSVTRKNSSGGILSRTWQEWAQFNSKWQSDKIWVWQGSSSSDVTAPATPSSEAVKVSDVVSYDNYGNPTEIKDANGKSTKYYYGDNTYPFSQNGLNGVPGHYLTGIQKVVGTANTSDGQTRPGDDIFIDAEYNTKGLLTKITDENSKTQTFSYDNLNRLTNVYNANGELVTTNNYYYSLDSNSSYTASDPNRVETWSHYDPNNSSNATKSVSYLDGLGREIQSQLRGGSTTIITDTRYNELGLPEVVSRPIEKTSITTYQQNLLEGTGSFTSGEELHYNSAVEDFYDPIVSGTDEDYAYSYTTYEATPLARPEKSTLPGTSHKMGSGREVVTTYGLNSSEIFTTSAHGATPAKTWSANTLSKTITEDPDGKKTISYTNGWGQTIASGVDMDGNNKLDRSTSDLVTEFAYDLRGNLVRVEDPRGLATTYTYNQKGELIEKKLPDQTHPHKYRYDEKGRLRFHRDPNLDASGDHYYYTKYDDLDRITEVGKYNSASNFDNATYINNQAWPTSTNTPYVYYKYDGASAYTGASNLKGRLTRVQYKDLSTGNWGYTWYSYNNQGLVEWVVQRLPGLTGDKRVEYEYNELGRMTRLKYNPSGSAEDHFFWYEYDELGRLEYVYSNTTNTTSGRIKEAEYTYTADGQVKQLKLGNSNIQTVDYRYTVQGWVDLINNPSSIGSDKFAQDLYYDYNGNIDRIRWEQPGYSSSEYNYYFGYDTANRLTSACYGSSSCNSSNYDVTYSYDKNGNLEDIYRNRNSSTVDHYNMVYLSGKNIVDYVSFGGTQQFSNDANGNITVNGIQGITGTNYDWRNLPYSVTTGSGTVQAGYDAEGNRVRKQLVSGVQTHYVRGANGETVAVYENGSRKFINLLAGSEMIGTWDGSQRRYFLKDHLGSVRTTVDQSGNVDGYDDYYPFGLQMPNKSSNSGNPNDNYKYTGHERDDEAGLTIDYMGARTYDPITARFMQVDPLASKYPSLSPYGYVANSPLNAIDPDGRLIIFINGQHYKNSGVSYWRRSGFDIAVMNHTNDFNPIYRDGASNGFNNTFSYRGFETFFKGWGSNTNLDFVNRYSDGYDQALRDFDMITAKLAPEETIKIITHSMGSMYGRGYAAALKKLIQNSNDPSIRSIKIEFIADFAPFQPWAYGAITGKNIGPTLQFSHCGDKVAGCEQGEGTEYQNTSDDEKQTHGIDTFLNQIKKLPAGKYVIKDGKIIEQKEDED